MFIFNTTNSVNASAINFTSVNVNGNGGISYSLGYEFTTNTDLWVTSLGMYDDFQNGLTESHDIGIYDSIGTLLGATTVDNNSYLEDWFRYTDISSIFLSADKTYYVAGVTGTENYTWDPNGFTVDPNINFVADAYIVSDTLAFPELTSPLVYAAGFGANFKLTTTNPSPSTVPEPSTYILLSSGLIALIYYKKQA